MSGDLSGCGDGSGSFDLRLNSFSSIYEIDYYESLTYFEAEKFCQIIGGTLLEKHSSFFPFDLWTPKRDGKCVKIRAFGGGEIITDCEESLRFACKKQKCHLLSFVELDGFFEIKFDEKCRDKFFNFVKKEEFFIIDERTGSRTQIKEIVTRYWPDDQTKPVNLRIVHETELDGKKYSLIDDFSIQSTTIQKRVRRFSVQAKSSSSHVYLSKIYLLLFLPILIRFFNL
ncbi:unnamed protein product [Oikopleura dioica]|uniref:C-type lectin domain-containing protein n=1 Tax=Oikopleura dioica TaxID=34765 RepID=E4WTT0_OIKDI|nr:unnamed protein product [Oikopleura dioica]